MRKLVVHATVALLISTLASIASAGHDESWLPAEPGWKWTYDVNKSFSKSRNSPFDGRVFRGGPVATVVAGSVVWQRA